MPARIPANDLPQRLMALAVGSGLLANGLAAILPVPLALAAGCVPPLAGSLFLGPRTLWCALPCLSLLCPGVLGQGGWIVAGVGAAAAAGLWTWHHDRALHRPQLAELHRCRAERERLRTVISRYPALHRTCQALSAARSTDQLAEVLAREALQILPTIRCIRIYIGVAEQLSCRASATHDRLQCGGEPGAAHRYVAGEARPLMERGADGLRMLLPLRGDRRAHHQREAMTGVLEAELPTSDGRQGLDLELLRGLAQIGGIGLAAIDLVAQARTLALRDDLTGLYGQHEFLRRLDEQVASARRNGTTVGLLMCDLDHLKRFNDTWGHAAGDTALLAVAEALRAAAQRHPGAISCRYGGEEFALCIPATSGDRLLACAEELRRAIAAAVPDPAHPQRRVTASIGAALLREGENGRSLLVRADAACYRAKDEGRDRVSDGTDFGPVAEATRILPAILAKGRRP